MNHIYIHVPFCAKRCLYCDFYSTTQTEELKELYVERAIKELAERKNFMPKDKVQTIYLGGGTPSQLSIKQIERLMIAATNNYSLIDNAEITLEANPDDITKEFANDIRKLGVNRVSLGIQSFNDNILQLLNRRHNAQQAIQAVNTLAQARITNISIDLIYGLPHQSEKQFESDLEQAFLLPITHLSSYALSVEQGTVLAKKMERGELTPTDEQSFINEYELLRQYARNNGFIHYEISNFSQPTFQSKHNSAYWDSSPYLGIGPGAHSYNGGRIRQRNLPNLKKYVSENKVPNEKEVLTDDELFDEMVFTSLRTNKGLHLKTIKENFPAAWENELLEQAQPHIRKGNLLLRNDNLTLAPQAIFISDSIISDFMRS